MRDFKDLVPGGVLSASDYNRLADAVRQALRITAEPPIQVVPDSTGLHIRIDLPGFWARLTSSSSPYSWTEMASNGAGVLSPYGRWGTDNAYEVNEVICQAGTVVWMTQNGDSEFLFENGSGDDDLSSSSGGGGSGSSSSGSQCVDVVTNVVCNASTSGGNALVVTVGGLNGSVTINGVTHPVLFSIDPNGCINGSDA